VDLARAQANLKDIQPTPLSGEAFVRAYDTRVMTFFGRRFFFDSTWSYSRGYRFNFKETHPIYYIAADHLTASSEIGPRTRKELLVPHLQSTSDPYLYVTIKVTAQLLDLTTEKTRDDLEITVEELLKPTKEWDDDMERGIWSATHEIGRLVLRDDRFDGIIYPSFPAEELLSLGGKQNVAVFMDPSSDNMARPLRSDVRLEIVDAGGVLRSLGLQF
jgi:RES domain-containing protein